jgi:hypothetical protein
VLAAALTATAVWETWISHSYLAGHTGSADPLPADLVAVVPPAVALLAAGTLLLARWLKLRGERRVALTACGLGILAITLLPAVWSLGTAQAAVSPPAAQPPRLAGESGQRRRVMRLDPRLSAFLVSQQHSEPFLVATLTAHDAAPLILATHRPVMALGGYMGTDPILQPEQLGRLVEEGQVRYALLAFDSAFGARAVRAQAPLIRWIAQHGTLVEPALWRTPRPDDARALREGHGHAFTPRLFDLRPATAAAAQPDSVEAAGEDRAAAAR